MPSLENQPPSGPNHPENADNALPPAPRFACPSLEAQALSEAPRDAKGNAVLTLDPDQSRHAVRTLRLSAGDSLGLLDGRGNAAWAMLDSANPKAATCVVVRTRSMPAKLPRLTLATAIPKGPRGDAMINDLAQLGVDQLIPMKTQRSVVHPSEAKRARYRKAGIEAAKQSGRAWFMEVTPLTPLSEVIAQHTQTAVKLLADPTGQSIYAISHQLAQATSIAILIGPEGGFAPAEVAAAQDAGFIPWRFSENTLRIETAAAAAVAILRAMV